MPKSLPDACLHEFNGRLSAGILGVAWGAIAGAVIGTGISLAVSLFYTSVLILAVIGASGVLGAMIGYVMARLLTDDAIYITRFTPSDYTSRLAARECAPCDHKNLKVKKGASPKEGALPGAVLQVAEVKVHISGPARDALLPSYHADEKLFNLIVATAHKAEVGGSK